MPERNASRSRRQWQTQSAQAFLNVPYDAEYEDLYLAFIAGLVSFGLTPRATIEIPSSDRRLDRIIKLIRSCRYSFHDLSRVELDTHAPATPRFNMPFELGVAVGWSRTGGRANQWFVLESTAHRLEKSLSDLNGTDPFIHGGQPRGILAALSNALSRPGRGQRLSDLERVFADLKVAAQEIRRDASGHSLFEARPFHELVISASEISRRRLR